jgi:acyl carrier protein
MFEQLKQILVTRFHVPSSQVVPDATLADLDLDSLDVVELVEVLKDVLGIAVTEDDLAETDSIAAIIALSESRRATA